MKALSDMLCNRRSSDSSDASKGRLATLLSLLAGLLLLGIAAPMWAQVTTTQTAVTFSSVAVGASTGSTQILSFTVPSGITLGGISAVSEGAANLDFTVVAGGTCAAGSTKTTCTVQVQFLPKAVGLRLGAVVLTDQSTPPNTLITVPLCGTGTGPLAAFGPGVITTIAGDYSLGWGYSGDLGPATSAQFNNPQVLVFDGAGNLYIVDGGNNVIREVTPGGTISTVLKNGGLDGYTGVAIDGAGNLYALNDVIWKLPPGGTSAIIPGGGLGVMGIAVDGSGNLYVVDRINDIVSKITPAGTITTVAGSGPCTSSTGMCFGGDGGPATSAQLSGAWDVAVDGSGNLYIADTGNDVIRKVTPGGTITTVAGKYEYVASNLGPVGGYGGDGGPATSAQLNSPYSIALDGAGNLYIADTLNNVIRKVNPSGTISTVAGDYGLGAGYSGNGGPATSAQLDGPRGIAVDVAGNLYIGDSNNNVIRKVDVSDAPSLTFASTEVGAASASQDVSVLNLGNAALTISQISTATNFSLGGSDTSCSSTGQALSAAASCVLGIEFNPTAGGSIAGSVVLTDNTLNASSATQTITLQGAATTPPAPPIAATTTTLTATPASVTLGAITTLTASVGSATAGTITGSVTFKVGSTTIGTSPVSGGTATLSNVTVSTSNGFSVGSDPITASYGGGSNFSGSSGNTTLTVTAPATPPPPTPPAATTTTLTATPASVTLGATTTLSASVGSATAGTITGSVTFQVGSTTIGTSPVSGGTAVLSNVTVSTSNGFSVGSDPITASYSGGTNFSASSGNTTLTVTAAAPPTVPTYTFGMADPAATVAAGSSETVALNLTSTNYAGTINFATSVTTANGTASAVTASASPVTLTSGGNATCTVTITTTTSAATHAPSAPWKSGIVMMCAVLLGAPFTLRRKRVLAVLMTALAISLAGFLIACGSASSSTKSTTTTARTYTVTVTPTGTGTVTNPAAVSITVTVQ